ncbi:MAG: 6-pyruvoyl trahydropterin synthase family protein, partial [Ardenticatenaceae bacterium]
RFQVTKVMEFAYGHRLLDYEGKCRYLHGHNALLEVDIAAESLDKLGMVADFTEVRDVVKGWIDAHLDHRMILCRRDPVVPVLQEMGEPLYLMDENPTAENISRLIFHQAREHGLPVTEVRLWETPTSCAAYHES